MTQTELLAHEIYLTDRIEKYASSFLLALTLFPLTTP